MTRGLWLLAATLLTGCAAAGDPAREPSGAPGINDRWKSDEIEPLIARMEGESREIWVNREVLADVVAPRPGSVVADVGAGSGFLSLLLHRQTAYLYEQHR